MLGLRSAVVLALCACSAEVAGGLDEREAREVVAVLARAGVPTEREATGEGKDRRFSVEVPSGEVGRATALLAAEGLPRAPEQGFHELYAAASMIPTATEEKARFLDALSGEIAGHLERLSGVADASVIVTSPTEDPLSVGTAPAKTPTASVLLRLRPGAPPPATDDVRRLVAGAVEGLRVEDVTVVMDPVEDAPPPTPLLAQVGPIRVARSSRGLLVGMLASGLGVIILMGLWILRSERRVQRSALRRPEGSEG